MKNDKPDNRPGDNASPYPVSRLAPAFGLVNLAREIAVADEMLANRADAKLQVIARQVRLLQEQAREILEETRLAQRIHHARCNFRKHPGQVYHLYQDTHDNLILSMLSPNDWRGDPPNRFLGSYRLESDRSWTVLAKPGRSQAGLAGQRREGAE